MSKTMVTEWTGGSETCGRNSRRHCGRITLSQSKRPPVDLRLTGLLPLLLLATTIGCSDADNSAMSDAEMVTTADVDQTSGAERGSPGSTNTPATQDVAQQDDFDFAPLGVSSLGGDRAAGNAGGTGTTADAELRNVIAHLQPLQVLLGSWRGTTRREFDGFKAVDEHEWVWDLRTDPKQPALTLESDKSPYMRSARLTWDSQQDAFVLQVTDASGTTRTLAGDFTDPVHEEVGSDDKLHRVFRLQFTEAATTGSDEYWQIAIAQQENNRYLLELDKRRGKAAFRRFDTVSTQRAGTSFALSDSGYAEKTCIISEGLGTTEITYKGRSYWVCCSGCKAAFEEDPEKWIAVAAQRAEARKVAENEN